MFRSASVILLTVLLVLASLPFTQMPMANAEGKCPHKTDESRVGADDVRHYYDGCTYQNQPKLLEDEVWEPEEKDEKLPILNNRPRYKIRYHEQCEPGSEDVQNCDSNPDITKCKDGAYPLIRQIFTTEDEFVSQRRYCPGDPLPPNIEESDFVEPLVITPDQFRSFPIAGSKLTSNPNRFSLRNGHTHFWASEDAQEFTSNLSGADVRIRAIPVQWNWNYGDGATNSFDFPGENIPTHTLHQETPTSHSYENTGTFSVSATTLYRGEFSVDGGSWQAIPGQAVVPSEPIEIDVWRTAKELISNE
ncbi:hypothetical protein [Glutamicibacter arilaitensis]|uniref:hypothetical protein n=1 Tax=Glutamicibacter arilaitensis TaxID=256701 RepID=UPI003A92C325